MTEVLVDTSRDNWTDFVPGLPEGFKPSTDQPQETVEVTIVDTNRIDDLSYHILIEQEGIELEHPAYGTHPSGRREKSGFKKWYW
ncbi:MAG: hypothetical protein HYV38_03435 [Candidatus Levybacteria bacterium]|nr:hypothetical protein [Candidatus Levybacteria bacterium]MBI2421110.1 hypothetical protein [Candidatus Levybacteria bacterium]MBI4097590.1 hypothetical protein [Candidatus Levybacteria bacterium]